MKHLIYIRLLLLVLMILFGSACGKNSIERHEYRFSVKKMWANQGKTQWDLFDDKPELYVAISSGTSREKTKHQTHGAWTIDSSKGDPDYTIELTDNGQMKFKIALIDDDTGDDDDFYTSDDFDVFSTAFFSLVNDADDKVLMENIEFTTNSYDMTVQNEYGGVIFDFEVIK